MAGDRHHLFLVYAAGNFIEATDDTPYLQIGELKYGKPILDRIAGFGMPLAEAERQLALSPVLRCHRSYLVRLPAIESAQGNAQGCELRLRDVPDVIPVSRSRVAALREAWKSNN